MTGPPVILASDYCYLLLLREIKPPLLLYLFTVYDDIQALIMVAPSSASMCVCFFSYPPGGGGWGGGCVCL